MLSLSRMNRLLSCAALALAACTPEAPAPHDATLDPPSRGFQLTVPPFEVAPGDEVQDCYFYKVPDLNGGKPYFVDRIEIAQNEGSHHMNIFRQGTVLGLKGPEADGTGVVRSKNGKGPCFVSANWADWPLVTNSQIASQPGKNYEMTLPANVGYRFEPGEILMLQTHFVNATTQATPGRGKVLANFYRSASDDNMMELGTLFATQQSIAICRDNPSPRFSGFCRINSPDKEIHVFAANGHFHSRGTRFTMCPWDGTSTDACTDGMFYESRVWDEPPMLTGLDVKIPANAGVRWSCSYEYKPSPACADCSCLKDPQRCCYGFGGLVETSEHCNAFVYYWPKVNNTDIICQ